MTGDSMYFQVKNAAMLQKLTPTKISTHAGTDSGAKWLENLKYNESNGKWIKYNEYEKFPAVWRDFLGIFILASDATIKRAGIPKKNTLWVKAKLSSSANRLTAYIAKNSNKILTLNLVKKSDL